MESEQARRFAELVRETVESELPSNYSGKLVVEANLNNGIVTEATMTKKLKLK